MHSLYMQMGATPTSLCDSLILSASPFPPLSSIISSSQRPEETFHRYRSPKVKNTSEEERPKSHPSLVEPHMASTTNRLGRGHATMPKSARLSLCAVEGVQPCEMPQCWPHGSLCISQPIICFLQLDLGRWTGRIFHEII